MEHCKFRVMDKCKCKDSSQLFCIGKCDCFEPEETNLIEELGKNIFDASVKMLELWLKDNPNKTLVVKTYERTDGTGIDRFIRVEDVKY